MKSNNLISYSRVSCFLLMYLVLWAISPPLFVSGLGRIIAFVSMCGILVNELWNRKIPMKYLFALISYLLFTCLIGISIQGIYYITDNIQQFIILCMAFICMNNMAYYEEKKDKYNLEKIFTAILIIYPIWMIITLIAYTQDPYISRALSGSRVVDEYYWSWRGVGGYSMIYSLVFYNIILLYLLLSVYKFKSNKKIILILFNYLLSLIIIMNAGYSIATIAVIIGSAIVLLIRNNHIFSLMIVITVLFSLLIIFYMFQEDIFQALISISRNTLYESKVDSIIYFMLNGDSSGSLQSRMVLYEYSLRVFQKNILFGTGLKGNLTTGGHSLFLDSFAKFGLLGTLPLLYLILYYLGTCIKKNRAFSLSVALLFVTLFIGMTNTIAAAIGPILYIVYPYVVNREGGLYGAIRKDNQNNS